MLFAALAPEWILIRALRKFYHARFLLGHLLTHGGVGWTLVHAEFAVAGGIRVKKPGSYEVEPHKHGSSLRDAAESGQINEPPISEEELKSRSKSDGIVKLIALLQITWFSLQALFRAIQHLQVTALEIMTIAFFILAVLIYAFYWNRPQDIEYPIIIKIQNEYTNVIQESPGGNVGTESRGNTKVWFPDGQTASWLTNLGLFVIITFIAPLFGAIHCLAWDAPFPTSKEALAWRICAVATTCLPLLACALFFLGFWVIDRSEYDVHDLLKFVLLTLVALYAIARITLITLAFMSLRALPADAFQTIAWTNYVPNLGV